MPSHAQALDLVDDPELIAEYDAWHRRVWPEVIAGLRAIGIERMKIYRLGTRLFMYYETAADFDPERDYQRYAADPRTREWDEMMRRYQRRAPGGAGAGDACDAPGTSEAPWWTPMTEVFDLESA